MRGPPNRVIPQWNCLWARSMKREIPAAYGFRTFARSFSSHEKKKIIFLGTPSFSADVLRTMIQASEELK
jgi:hypothetical protein